MKKIILCSCILIVLFGCHNTQRKEDNVVQKMINAMKKHDSFKVEVKEMYTLPGESTRENTYDVKINNYYDEKNKEAVFYYKASDDFKKGTILYASHDKVTMNDKDFEVNLGYDLFYSNFEYLNLKKNIGTIIQYKDVNDDLNLSFTLKFSSKELQKEFFGGNNLKREDDPFDEGSIEIRLNEDYTIKNCYVLYHFKSSINQTSKLADIKFVYYGHQEDGF